MAKKSAAKTATKKKTSKKSAALLNETGNRKKAADRRQEETKVAEKRRKVQRRRQIDPTTCERDYTDEEVEFMQALDQYKRDSGRMFPTCSEILEVLRKIGYTKQQAGQIAEDFSENCEELVDEIEANLDAIEM